MTRQDDIEASVAKLIAGFGQYVQAYDDDPPFSDEQLRVHRATIALRQQAGSVRAAVQSDTFITSLYQTLRAWRLGQRQSRLVPIDAFASALRASLPRLEQLEPRTINGSGLPPDLTDQLWQLVNTLGIVENYAKIVAGTKALHHLLPELVPPIDREYTGAFFGFHRPEFQDSTSQRHIFSVAYDQLARVAREVRPEHYVTGTGWRTSRTKILDNAVVGFRRTELDEPTVSLAEIAEAVNLVSFTVQGFPPAKNEAKSMLSFGHLHADRVHLLLIAAEQACLAQDFTPIEAGNAGLDVTMYAPAGQNPADATNYLGGIGDVLEHKAQRGPLEHLGELAHVWLYRNDRQIKAVAYREVDADHISYAVTVRELNP